MPCEFLNYIGGQWLACRTKAQFANINPGVHVNGWVVIGARATIGTGASIINGSRGRPLVIGDDAIVGMGACVIRPVAAGTTVVGVPARPISG